MRIVIGLVACVAAGAYALAQPLPRPRPPQHSAPSQSTVALPRPHPLRGTPLTTDVARVTTNIPRIGESNTRLPLPRARPADPASHPEIAAEPAPRVATVPTPRARPSDAAPNRPEIVTVEPPTTAAEPAPRVATVPAPRARPSFTSPPAAFSLPPAVDLDSEAHKPVELPPSVFVQKPLPPAVDLDTERHVAEAPPTAKPAPMPEPAPAPAPAQTAEAAAPPTPAPAIEEKPAAPSIAHAPLPRQRPAEPAPSAEDKFAAVPLPKTRPSDAAPRPAEPPADVAVAQPAPAPVAAPAVEEKAAAPAIAAVPLPKTRPSDAPRIVEPSTDVVIVQPAPTPAPVVDEKPAEPAIAAVPLPKTRPSDAPRVVEPSTDVVIVQPAPAPIIVEEQQAAAPTPPATAAVPVPKTRPSDAPRPAEPPADVAVQLPTLQAPPSIIAEEKPAAASPPPAVAAIPLPPQRPSEAEPRVPEQPPVIATPAPAPGPAPTTEDTPAVAAIPLPRERPPAEQAQRPGARFTIGALRKLYENEMREQREREKERFELPPKEEMQAAPADPHANDPIEQPVPPASDVATAPDAKPADSETTVTAALQPEIVPALPMPVILRVPYPKKRPDGAIPRLFEGIFRELRVTSPGTECTTLMSSGVIVAERLPGIGRGACHLPDAVKISSIVMPDKRRVEFVPAATMRCRMALEIINWVRGDVAAAAAIFNKPIVGIRNYDSYNCRSMSSSRKMLSEHGKGNALDINSFLFAGGAKMELTDRHVLKNFRHKLRTTACKRFKTVLGPGVPQHHDHIHVDLRKHYGDGGICHWNVL